MPEAVQVMRKYWDEDYVHNLEQQVQILLEVVKGHEERQKDGTSPPSSDAHQLQPLETALEDSVTSEAAAEQQKTLDQDRSLAAMEELSVMMWRTNLGDAAVVIQNDLDSGLHQGNHHVEMDMRVLSPPPSISRYCEDRPLLARLAAVFLDSINREHQFTEYRTTSFIENYPHQPVDLVVLHSAILAVGAAFLSARDPSMVQISEDFARYAAGFLLDVVQFNPSIAVLQGLCILSFRALSLGIDHLGWMFISMAGGLCVHLRLHVLAVDECSTPSREASMAEIRAFWMFYFIDKSAVTILGRNCALPWRRVNVPELESILGASHVKFDLADVSFAWQCRLWYAHDAAMDQICARSFESLPAAQQSRLLVSTLDQLNTFFRSRPTELDLRPGAAKPVLLFHLQYHMAIMIIISPFLRLSTVSDRPRSGDESRSDMKTSSLLVLRSITASASDSIRLCRTYHGTFTFDAAHPVLAHHLLSAALVHLMNATSSSAALRRQSAHWLRVAVELLDRLRVVWPARADKSIRVLRVLARKWGTIGALPLRFSGPIEPSVAAVTKDQDGSYAPSFGDSGEGQDSAASFFEAAAIEDYEAQFPELFFTLHDPALELDLQSAFLELANVADTVERT
ncbi:hypothetical protein ACHAQA_000863 [Verticillium albo-atrum]